MPAHTKPLKRMSLRLVILLVAIGTIAGGYAARAFAASMNWDGPASYYKANRQVGLAEQSLSADESLWVARNKVAPSLDVAEERFEGYLRDKGIAANSSKQLVAVRYLCEAERLNRYDVAYATWYYTPPVLDANGHREGPTLFDALESGTAQVLADIDGAGLACPNRAAIETIG